MKPRPEFELVSVASSQVKQQCKRIVVTDCVAFVIYYSSGILLTNRSWIVLIAPPRDEIRNVYLDSLASMNIYKLSSSDY